MSEKLQIFEGLSLSMEAVRELACYWNVADDDIGTIDSKGNMKTSDDVWNRPCADKNYKVLRDALEENQVDWIVLTKDKITIDFSKLRYNGTWLKKMFANRGLGVCDSEKGLKLFQKRETSGGVWYEELFIILRGVTVDRLGLEQSKVLSLTPNSQNPDEAEWAKLYFVS